jgi:hypothetical protein
MTINRWMAATFLTLIVGMQALCGEPEPYTLPAPREVPAPYSLQAACGAFSRLGPAGGWRPYGGGILSWWNPHCFPHAGAPDDYCRKSLPNVCWHSYPPFYTYGPPDTGLPHHQIECASKKVINPPPPPFYAWDPLETAPPKRQGGLAGKKEIKLDDPNSGMKQVGDKRQ